MRSELGQLPNINSVTSPPLKLVHIISGLGQGGAETVLYRLLGALQHQGFDMQVVSLLDRGVLGPRIEALGIPVFTLEMRPGVPNPIGIVKLARLLQVLTPDLVQTWMYHADLLGGLAARLAGIRKVVWNIRQSNLDPKLVKLSTRITARTAARLSHILPNHIVCCSERAKVVHSELGYRRAVIEVIPNGLDLAVFKPDTAARAAVRTELGVTSSTPLIGLVARFDPQKNHAGFLQAATILAQRHTQCAFVLCGTDVTWDNPALAVPIHAAKLTARCHLLGSRNDIPAIHAALDISVCASGYGEGFPNAVAESMACGVPGVVTDVGDAAQIVGDTGLVVPTQAPRALASALAKLLGQTPEHLKILGSAARQRIQQHYTIEKMAHSYMQLYRRLCKRK